MLTFGRSFGRGRNIWQPKRAFGIASWPERPFVGCDDPAWGTDATDPYHGKACLRMSKSDLRRMGFFTFCGPQHDRPMPYVFSVYLKGDRGGIKVRLHSPGLGRTDVALRRTRLFPRAAGPGSRPHRSRTSRSAA